MRRSIVVGCAILGAALVCGSVLRAEVRGLTDRYGVYRGTRILTINGGHVWTPFLRATAGTLNPQGDQLGDLWPTIVESSVGPRLPWAVWSRENGSEYDLAWSRWIGPGWQTVSWLTESDQLGDDLDADLGFDAFGRPYVVWWRHEGTTGRIYFSVFLQTQWMPPLAVSESVLDGRYPQFVEITSEQVTIRYEAAGGMVEQSIQLHAGDGITDDVDPMDFTTVDAPRHIQENNP